MRRMLGRELSWLALVVPLVGGCGQAMTNEQAAEFVATEEAFSSARTAAEYLGVASRYQSLIDGGVQSSALLYNQGNAYLNAGRRGQAIACYEQALWDRPRDRQLLANLALARGEIPGRDSSLGQSVFFWNRWLSYLTQFVLFVLAAVSCCALAVCWIVFRREISRRLMLASMPFVLLLGLAAGSSWWSREVVEHGVVTGRNVVARKGSAESYEPAFTEPLSEGLPLTVVDRREGWILGEFPGGKTGWVIASEVVTY